VEVKQRRERATFEELLLQIEEGSLDLALGLRAIRPTRAGLHTVVAAQLQELWVPSEVVGIGVGDQGPSVVDQEFLRRTSKMMKTGLDRFEDRRLGLIQAERVVLASAVTQGQAEHDHFGQLATHLERVR